MLRVYYNSDTVLEITGTNIIKAGPLLSESSRLKGGPKEVDEYTVISSITSGGSTTVEATGRARDKKPRIIVKTKGKHAPFPQFSHVPSLTSRTTKERDIS